METIGTGGHCRTARLRAGALQELHARSGRQEKAGRRQGSGDGRVLGTAMGQRWCGPEPATGFLRNRNRDRAIRPARK